MLEQKVIIIILISSHRDYTLSTVTNDLDVIRESHDTYLAVRILIVHFLDLSTNGLLDTLESVTAHRSGDIDAIDNRNIFCKSQLLRILHLLFSLTLSGCLNFGLLHRSGLKHVADSFGLRVFLGVHLKLGVRVVAELALPGLGRGAICTGCQLAVLI